VAFRFTGRVRPGLVRTLGGRRRFSVDYHDGWVDIPPVIDAFEEAIEPFLGNAMVPNLPVPATPRHIAPTLDGDEVMVANTLIAFAPEIVTLYNIEWLDRSEPELLSVPSARMGHG
jgi:hypothetical protein